MGAHRRGYCHISARMITREQARGLIKQSLVEIAPSGGISSPKRSVKRAQIVPRNFAGHGQSHLSHASSLPIPPGADCPVSVASTTSKQPSTTVVAILRRVS